MGSYAIGLQRKLKSLPSVTEPAAFLLRVEDATQEAHDSGQQLYECVDTCSSPSLNGSHHLPQRHPTCSYSWQDVQES